jgi:Domain of unknown function (DUF4351)
VIRSLTIDSCSTQVLLDFIPCSCHVRTVVDRWRSLSLWRKGLQQGEADLVLRQLQSQCGVLSIDKQDLVRSLPIAQLENLGEAL